MFKRLSIFAVIFSGVLLAGCSQQSASTQSASSSDTATKSSSTKKAKAPAKTTKSAPADTKSASDTNSSSDESKTTDSQNSSNNSNTNQTNDNSTNNNDTNDSSTTNNDQTSQSQGQQQTQVSLTTSDQAVQFLADKLSSTYDKSTTQYVANGKVTWDNVTGYQINIYSKNSDSPVGSYLVPANGQYFQIW